MSEENIEIIRRCFEALNRGDRETTKQFAHPDCVIHTRTSGVAGRRYRGPAGAEQWFADVGESWATIEQTPQRFIEVDDERTIVVVRFQATGRRSGVEIDQADGADLVGPRRSGDPRGDLPYARRGPRSRRAERVGRARFRTGRRGGVPRASCSLLQRARSASRGRVSVGMDTRWPGVALLADRLHEPAALAWVLRGVRSPHIAATCLSCQRSAADRSRSASLCAPPTDGLHLI